MSGHGHRSGCEGDGCACFLTQPGDMVDLENCGSVFSGTVLKERIKPDDTGREVLIRHAYGNPFWTDKQNIRRRGRHE